MAEPSDITTVRLLLDGDWQLRDFRDFIYDLGQSYIFHTAFAAPQLFSAELNEGFSKYGWRGDGYSAGHFYSHLRRSAIANVPPRIAQMRMASPGILDLVLSPVGFAGMAGSVWAIAKTLDACHQMYLRHSKEMRERKLTSIKTEQEEIQLAKDYKDYLSEVSDEMADAMDLKILSNLRGRTRNELRTVKLLRSQYRYEERLAKRVASEQVEMLPEPTEDEPSGQEIIRRLVDGDPDSAK